MPNLKHKKRTCLKDGIPSKPMKNTKTEREKLIILFDL